MVGIAAEAAGPEAVTEHRASCRPFGRSSSAVNVRPWSDRRAEEPEEIGADLAGAQLLGHVAAGVVDDAAAKGRDVLHDVALPRQCVNFAGEAAGPEPCGEVFMNNTMRSGSGTATGFSSTALTTEKIAVFAPMPSVSAATAASVNAGALIRVRMVYRRSLSSSSMYPRVTTRRRA